MNQVLWELLEETETQIGAHELRDTLKKYLLRRTYAGEIPTARKWTPRSWTEEAYWKQKGICKRCKTPMEIGDATEDHWKSLNRGGAHKKSNIRAICAKCNSEKSDATEIQESKRTGQTILEQAPVL